MNDLVTRLQEASLGNQELSQEVFCTLGGGVTLEYHNKQDPTQATKVLRWSNGREPFFASTYFSTDVLSCMWYMEQFHPDVQWMLWSHKPKHSCHITKGVDDPSGVVGYGHTVALAFAAALVLWQQKVAACQSAAEHATITAATND